tara:strand:+ start:2751 stop:3092 length:342 start_codon:yes stop_codon:yes gene_type:complete
MTITLNSSIDNASLQVGDQVFYSVVNNLPNTTQLSSSDIVGPIGVVVAIGSSYIQIDNEAADVPSGAFLMFCKDGRANKSNLKGYYASITMTNSSDDEAELFAISSEMTESSK